MENVKWLLRYTVKRMELRMAETVDMTKGVYRKVYAGFLNGRRINAVSIEAEAWFWRLNALADDFGNFPADIVPLRNASAGRRDVSTAQVAAWVVELENVKLLRRYTVDGDEFLNIIDFQKLQPPNRNGRRIQRYPGASGCIRVHPGDNDSESEAESEAETESDVEAGGIPGTPPPSPLAFAALGKEGFAENDELLRDPACTAEQAEIAIANADALAASGKLKSSRRSYIASAIRGKYSLSPKARKLLEAREKRRVVEERKLREAEQVSQLEADQKAGAMLPAEEFSRIAKSILDALPNEERKFAVKRPIQTTNPWWQMKVGEFLRKRKGAENA